MLWTSVCQYPDLLGQNDVEYSRYVCNYSSPGYRIFILTTPGTVSQPQQIYRVLMLIMTGTVLCGPRAIFLAEVSGVPVRSYPAMKPTAQPNGRVCAACGPATGSPTAKPKLGASYLTFGLGHGYLRDIRHRRQCCGRPVRRAEESVEGASLHGVYLSRATHPIGVRLPRSESCFGRALWSAAKRACLDIGAVSLPFKLQN